MKYFSILLVLFSLPLISIAQNDFRPGYIVNLQGDTLRGEVNFKGDVKNAMECTFRKDQGFETKVFTPEELAGYGFFGDKQYEAKTALILKRVYHELSGKFEEVPVAGNGSINFMQVLVKGAASLYFMKDINSETHYYLQKGQEPLKELVYFAVDKTVDVKTSKKFHMELELYKGTLRSSLQDCPAIISKIDKTGFNPSNLKLLVSFYNSCVEPEKQTLVAQKKKPDFTFGVLAGISFSNLTIVIENHYLSLGDYSSAPAPTVGFFVDFTLPSLNEKLSIHNSLFYTVRNYEALISKKEYSYVTNYDVAYKFSYLRFETALRYTLPEMKITPFIQAGLANNFMQSGNESIFYTVQFANNPVSEPKRMRYLNKIFRQHQVGLHAGTGIKHSLKNKSQLILQGNYELNTGFTKGVGVGSKSHNVALLFGMAF